MIKITKIVNYCHPHLGGHDILTETFHIDNKELEQFIQRGDSPYEHESFAIEIDHDNSILCSKNDI